MKSDPAGKILPVFLSVMIGCLLTACATVRIPSEIGREVTATSYGRERDEKGVVIMAINWSRRWGCGGFENAELRSISFDLLPPRKFEDGISPDIQINGPPRLVTTPLFKDYVLLVRPGEYALSGFEIKVARSISEGGYHTARRSDLLEDGEPSGGTFKIEAGETVYIGHFFVGCASPPLLWRYYTEGQEGFKKYLDGIKMQYPFLDLHKTQFRLFQTKVFGVEYQLD